MLTFVMYLYIHLIITTAHLSWIIIILILQIKA